MSNEPKKVYMAWTLKEKSIIPALRGIFDDMEDAKAACTKDGDSVQTTMMNKELGEDVQGIHHFAPMWFKEDLEQRAKAQAEEKKKIEAMLKEKQEAKNMVSTAGLDGEVNLDTEKEKPDAKSDNESNNGQ